MQRPESVLKNKTHNVPCDFEMQTGYLVPTKKPNLVIVYKRKGTFHHVAFTVPADHQVKIKRNH